MGIEQDHRDKIFRELILAGINPFFEMDAENMPAEGADWLTYFPSRKIYGNAIDGIPGITRTDADTVHNLSETVGTVLTDTEALLTTIDVDTGGTFQATQRSQQYGRMRNPVNVALAPGGPVPLDNYETYITTEVLSGNAGTDHEVMAASVGKTFYVKFIRFATDNVTAPQDSGFNFAFNTEDTGVDKWISIGQQQMGTMIQFEYLSAATNKALHMDTTSVGCAAASEVYVEAWGGYL